MNLQHSAALQTINHRPSEDIENGKAEECWDDNSNHNDDGEHGCFATWGSSLSVSKGTRLCRKKDHACDTLQKVSQVWNVSRRGDDMNEVSVLSR